MNLRVQGIILKLTTTCPLLYIELSLKQSCASGCSLAKNRDTKCCDITQQLIKNKLTLGIEPMKTKVKTLQHNRLNANSFFSKTLKAN